MAVLTLFICRLTKGLRIAALILAAVLLFGQQADAQTRSLNEEKIKAGLLYNFLKYTEWPANGGTLNVCLFRGDPFSGSLNPLKGRTAQQSKIKITRISSPAEIGGCNLLFVHSGAAASVPAVLSAAGSKGVLTMSDIRGFARMGGMVELSTREDRRIHMIVNLRAAEQAGLRIQPRMTRLAEVVQR